MSYKQKPVREEKVPYTTRIQNIIDAHDAANIVYVLNGDDYHEMEFEEAVRARPETLQNYVISIYRIKTQKKYVIGGTTDEALVYYQQRTAEAYNGKHVQDDRIHGVYMKPVTRANRNEMGKSNRYDKIGEIPYFQIPFSPKAVDEIIKASVLDVDKFIVAYGSDKGPDITAGEKYSIHNKEDFKTGTFQELYDMGRYNYTAKEPRLVMWRSEGESIRKQTQNFQILTGSSKF